MNRRRILTAIGALATANLLPAPSRASGQDEPPIAEVKLEEPVEESADAPAVTRSSDRDRSGFASPVAAVVTLIADGSWNASVPDDALLETLDTDGLAAMVDAALARADG